MKDLVGTPYPGDEATAVDIGALAKAYHDSAIVLMSAARKGRPLTRAPAHWCALQAIELYLSMYLRRAGVENGDLRAHNHNLDSMCSDAEGQGLVLRERTRDHLRRTAEMREYLVSRYAPEQVGSLSEVTRLLATLEEIARKTAEPSPHSRT